MVINYLKFLYKKLVKRDFKWLLFEIIYRVTFKKLELRIDNIVEKKRKSLAKKISNIYNNTVQQGPFKGMQINDDQFWGEGEKINIRPLLILVGLMVILQLVHLLMIYLMSVTYLKFQKKVETL